MARRRTPADVSEGRIDEADRAGKRKPPKHVTDTERGRILLAMPRYEIDRGPARVTVGLVNWREPASWEVGLVVEARMRERHAEMDLFRGLIG